ncbi:peptidoglycan D,D-transpeptidase FtsI family protein [Peribacillus kribbensis]|uniref:peptidoglycan D,D-transpeptidase FtsI family protein n=1 Tax=Peribacillus kribbensis TaxID=356658 RepID=UPI000422B492|nr:penicillin-binding protein 2 [Peribacillus kribbensis]
MPEKRMKWTAVFLMVLLAALTGRLAQIQLVQTESFTKHNINLIQSSVTQRTQALSLDNGRGKFYDRSGNPLGHEEIPVLVLFPFLKDMKWPSEKVAEILGVKEEALTKAVKNAKKPFAFGGRPPIVLSEDQMAQINELKFPGVFAVERSFSRKMPAEQLIGTLTKWDGMKAGAEGKHNREDWIGNSGLQAALDEFLSGGGESKLVYHVDGMGGPLFGINVKYVDPSNPLYPVKVITTLDKELQLKAEKLADSHQIKNGGLVLLDIDSGEIRAIVSRPDIDNKDPNTGSQNKMFSQEKIGSVFKTVVAAAAIEKGLAKNGEMFDCNKTINGKKDPIRNLGFLDFEESFAQSCNRTFGDLAVKLQQMDMNILEEYAGKLGLIGKSGWTGQVYHTAVSQLYREDAGRIWADGTDRQDKKLTAYTGIGQQDVQVTPLAAANMMASIARGGKAMSVKAVSRIEFKNGSTVFKFPEQPLSGAAVAPYTAMKLQTMLRNVVTDEKGTGRVLQDLPYEAAGKSGTAQTGLFQDGKELYNKWFAGYFPYRNPKYALAVVNLGVPEDEGGVNLLFADIIKAVYSVDMSRSDGP